jgi:hypothetical protein
MRKIKRNFGFIIAFGLILFGLASHAFAQQNQNASKTMRQINIKFEDFRYNLNENLINGSFSRSDQDEVKDLMNNLEDSIVDLDNKLQKNNESADDISTVNSASENLNNFISRSRFDSKVTRSWNDLRSLFTKLSSDYSNVSNNNNNYPTSNNYSTGLTGTYRLDTSRSDNAKEIVGEAIRNASDSERQTAEKHLAEKLESPEMMAFDVRGSQVSVGSTRSPQVTIDANGREKIQRSADGKNIRVQSTLNRDELTVSIEQEAQTGNRLRDYSYVVTFSPYENGKSLRVVRRLTDDEINQTFIVTSYYEKTSDVAQLDIYNNSNTNNDTGWSSNSDKRPTTNNGRTGDFVIADGVTLTARLQDNISTKVSQNGDRFRLRVEAPSQYRGAVIEGTVSGINRSGKIAGSSKLTFNFEKIRLTNGQTYDFAGFVQNITDANGKNVKIDEEGTVTGKSQTKETAKRGGIGAGAGAVLGAILGGAKGAVIGAVIGGGGGAGSVIFTGKNDVELTQGSSMTIQSSSPIR